MKQNKFENLFTIQTGDGFQKSCEKGKIREIKNDKNFDFEFRAPEANDCYLLKRGGKGTCTAMIQTV